jgi:proton-translocating NADH-quinone oxidoreductase chain M
VNAVHGLLLQAAPSPAPSGLPSGLPSGSASPSPAPTFGGGVITFSFLLSVLVWVPFVTAIVVAIMPVPRRRNQRRLLGIAFWVNLGLLFLTAIAYSQFSVYGSGVQFEERLPWMPSIGVSYHLGLNGVGMALLLLSGLVGVVACLAAYNLRDQAREFFTLLLLTQWAINGAITAQNFLLLVLFWAVAIVPVALLVGGWSGQRRWRTSARLAAYWSLGTAALLVAGLLLVASTGTKSLELSDLQQAQAPHQTQVAVAILVLVAAATRLPLVPLHGWVREVLAEVHPAVAVLLAGSVSRLGGLVLLELYVGANHDGARTVAWLVAAVAVATVVWAGLVAFATRDVRRVAAYLALIPGGVTVLGVAGLSPLSIDGTALSLFAGGLAGALIAGAGATFADHAQGRNVSVVAGLASRVPRLSWLLVAATLAVLCVPFMATFPALVMVLFGSMRTQPAATFLVLAGLGLAAAAAAWLLHRVLFGAPNPEGPQVADVTLSEAWYLGILVGALLWVGLVPGGPKVANIPIFDPGLVNVVTQATSEISSSYVPSPPPSPGARPSPSPSASGAPAVSPTP